MTERKMQLGDKCGYLVGGTSPCGAPRDYHVKDSGHGPIFYHRFQLMPREPKSEQSAIATNSASEDEGTMKVTFSVSLPKTNTMESVAEAFQLFVDYVKRSDGYPDRLLGDIPDFNDKWVNPNA